MTCLAVSTETRDASAARAQPPAPTAASMSMRKAPRIPNPTSIRRHALASSGIAELENSLHEPLASGQLIERHEFVRPVRLCNVPRSADHRGNPHFLEQPAFGAVGNLAHAG